MGFFAAYVKEASPFATHLLDKQNTPVTAAGVVILDGKILKKFPN